MKVVIATCYESNEERVRFVYDACKKRNYEVTVITSDFSHIRKERRNNVPADFTAVNALAYKKNLSLKRMYSHARFARDAFKKITEIDPDLIWLMAPANSLIRQAKIYKQQHKAKLIIDIIDMWPESLPVSLNKNTLPFNIWRNIRKNNISCADQLVTECDLYQEILGKEYNGRMRTIHWARDSKAVISKEKPADEPLSLVYIGSINNIIDADKIAQIIGKIDRKTVLHVIGEGENTDHFLKTAKEVCEVVFHGAIRDEDKKNEIFNKCHAGINIYKEGLYIGLTVKCIDYLEHGLPLINNIRGDTWKMVEEHAAGINIYEDISIDAEKLITMRKNNGHIYELYDRNFTKEVFTKKCLETIDEVLG